MPLRTSSAESGDHDGGFGTSGRAAQHGPTVLIWSPDSIHLAAGYSEGPVRVWSPHSGHVLPDTDGASVLAWSPDGTHLATAVSGYVGGNAVRMWDAVSGHTATVPDTEGATVLAWSHDSTRVCATNGAGALLDIDLRDRATSSRVVVGPARDLAWSAGAITGAIADRVLVIEPRIADGCETRA